MSEPDKNLLVRHFRNSLEFYAEHAKVQKAMAEQLVFELKKISVNFGEILEVGSGCGLLTELLENNLNYNILLATDIVKECEKFCTGRRNCRFIQADFDEMKWDCRFDLIISNAAFQWSADFAALPGKLSAALRSDGILAFTTFGVDNLIEIKALSGGALHYYSVAELSSFLDADFEIIFMEENHHILQFDEVGDILNHLKNTGAAGNFSGQKMWTKGRLAEFKRRYQIEFALKDGQLSLTYHTISVIAKKRSKS